MNLQDFSSSGWLQIRVTYRSEDDMHRYSSGVRMLTDLLNSMRPKVVISDISFHGVARNQEYPRLSQVLPYLNEVLKTVADTVQNVYLIGFDHETEPNWRLDLGPSGITHLDSLHVTLHTEYPKPEAYAEYLLNWKKIDGVTTPGGRVTDAEWYQHEPVVVTSCERFVLKWI